MVRGVAEPASPSEPALARPSALREEATATSGEKLVIP